MQASDQTTSQLHQQASAQYLQGKFDDALALWKKILEIDPNDERATEGVRLCELLTEENTDNRVDPAGLAVEAAEPETVEILETVEAIEAPIEFEVPSLEIDLPVSEALLDEVPEPVFEIDPAAAEVNPIVDGIFDEAPDAPLDPAAAELQKRVGNLLHEALEAYNTGNVESAREVLARVFILDESNRQALELQEMIEGGIPATDELVATADLDAPQHDAPPGAFDLTADAPDQEGQTIEILAPVLEPVAEPEETIGLQTDSVEVHPEPVVGAPMDEMDDPIPDEFDAIDDPDLYDPDSEPQSGERLSNAPKIKLPQLELKSSKSRWVVIGVVVGVVAVVGVGFWMKLSSIDVRDDVPPPPITGPSDAAPVNETPVEAPPVEATPQPVAAPTEDLATLLDRGRSAVESGDYAAAIVAFNSVLEQDPGNYEANERMEQATESYKEQQELQKQWLAATTLYREGEYRSALKMFYRLPEKNEEDTVRLNRYKENGWFNMGLLALRTGQCDLALSHLTEAEQLNPQDADISAALALCETCSGGGARRTGFQRAVNTMEIRGLDD